MLTDNVRRCAHLEIVELIIVRYKVRMPELDGILGVGAEEKWLRWPLSADCRGDILPQRNHSLLRKMPTLLVQDSVDLDDRRLISALVDIGVAKIRHRRIRIGRSRGRRQSVQDEISWLAVRLRTRRRPCGVLLHRSKFYRSSLFRKSEGIQTTAWLKLSLFIQRDEILREIPPRLKLFDSRSVQDQVPRQSSVEIDSSCRPW